MTWHAARAPGQAAAVHRHHAPSEIESLRAQPDLGRRPVSRTGGFMSRQGRRCPPHISASGSSAASVSTYRTHHPACHRMPWVCPPPVFSWHLNVRANGGLRLICVNLNGVRKDDLRLVMLVQQDHAHTHGRHARWRDHAICQSGAWNGRSSGLEMSPETVPNWLGGNARKSCLSPIAVDRKLLLRRLRRTCFMCPYNQSFRK